MYRTMVQKQGFVGEDKNEIIIKFLSWGYFYDNEGKKHKACIPDDSGNIKHSTHEDAVLAIQRCRAFLKKQCMNAQDNE